jgi:hypothetical protein
MKVQASSISTAPSAFFMACKENQLLTPQKLAWAKLFKTPLDGDVTCKVHGSVSCSFFGLEVDL